MGRIPEQTIQEIRDRIDIVDLIGRYVELKRAGGSNFKGLCPFHHEKTPSFNVNRDRQIFHCFGCDVGGNVFQFLSRHENLSFREAVEQLARDCGVEIPQTAGSGDRGETGRILEALEIAQRLYRESLAGREGAAARAYLEGRGLDAAALEHFGIGFAPDRWDAVASALERHGVPGEIGEKAGLVRKRERGGGCYDLLRGRVTFPIHDVRRRILGFGGRTLSAEDSAKYINTPETPVFRKREALYGLPHALEPMRKAGRAIVCEGYFDRIALERAGLGEAVATCGTALTADHGRQLRRRTRDVVLLFDGDAAGRKATWRALEVLVPEGLRVRAAALPSGADPDDVLARDGAEALRRMVDSAPDALELALAWALEEGCRTPAEKADAVGRVAAVVALVADPVERAEYARRVAVATDTDPRAVEAVIRSARSGRDASRTARDELVSARPTRELGLEERQLRLLAALLLAHPSLVSEGLCERLHELLPEGSWTSVVSVVCDAALEGELDAQGRVDVSHASARLDTESQARLRAIAVDDALLDRDAAPHAVLDDLLAWFDRRRKVLERRETTRRLSDPSADPAALLAEKQRQLEEKRAAHGVGSRSAR